MWPQRGATLGRGVHIAIREDGNQCIAENVELGRCYMGPTRRVLSKFKERHNGRSKLRSSWTMTSRIISGGASAHWASSMLPVTVSSTSFVPVFEH